MPVNLNDELDQAYASQIHDLFNIFVDNVAAATDKDAALADAGQKFLAGVNLVKTVLAKAKALLPPESQG